MAQFRTTRSNPLDVEISGLPLLPGGGGSGLDLNEAAAVMPELQDADGSPLKGAALEAAALRFAAGRPGITVHGVKQASRERNAEPTPPEPPVMDPAELPERQTIDQPASDDTKE
jgi:hypothetical protein